MNQNIMPLSEAHLPMYGDVILQSFATAAEDYGLTIENCPGHWSFITNEILSEKLKDSCYHPFGYFADNKIVGFAALTNKGEGVYEMGTVSILPEYRHLGYGKSLLDFCKDKIKQLGGYKIIISLADTDIRLKNWYISNGFIHTGTEKFEHLPLPVGYMEWEL